MISPQAQLRTLLKSQQQSLTQPRQIVFAALQHKEPQTLQEIIKACPQIDRASVYRTITLFEQLGIVQRLQLGWKYKLELSDTFHDHHHHLTCDTCGRIMPLPEDQLLEDRLRELARTHQFTMRAHQLEIHGRCHDCGN